MGKEEEGFGKIGANKRRRTVAPQQTVTPSPKKKKQGRPTFKKEDVDYTKVGCYIPTSTKKKMLLFLVDNNEVTTQSELIDAAILEYIKKRSS